MSTQLESKPKLEQFTVVERAVLYARTSGDDRGKEGRNLAGQLDMGREYANQKGYTIVAELPEDDRGASGAEIDLPQLNRVREMAHNHEFDVLIVRELDRLSRNLAKQLIVEEELRKCNIRIEYVLGEYDDTPEGRLQKHIRATVSEYEREKIRERMVRGRRNYVKAGNVLVAGRPPYGYRLTNQNEKTTLEICEGEARVVRLIFNLYIEGRSLGEIADTLTEMGIPTSYDTGERRRIEKRTMEYGQWSRGSVAYILTNETYIGVWYYGKRKKSKVDGKWTTIKNASPQSTHVPPIVSREEWEAVQTRRGENKKNSRRNTKHDYLFSKRITCGRCGYKIGGAGRTKQNGTEYLYYVCPSRIRDYTRKCDLPYFSASEVDAVIWAWIEELLADRDKLEKGLRGFQADKDKGNPLKERLAITEDLIKKHNTDWERKMENLDAAQSPRAKAKIGKEIAAIEAELERLEKEHTRQLKEIEQKSLTEEQIAGILDFIATVAANLDRFRKDFPSRRMLIEEIFDLRVTLVIEDGEKIAYVEGRPGKKRLSVVSSTHFLTCHNEEQNFIVMSARLVIGKVRSKGK